MPRKASAHRGAVDGESGVAVESRDLPYLLTLSKEVLRLKCDNERLISTGTKLQLATRLSESLAASVPGPSSRKFLAKKSARRTSRKVPRKTKHKLVNKICAPSLQRSKVTSSVSSDQSDSDSDEHDPDRADVDASSELSESEEVDIQVQRGRQVGSKGKERLRTVRMGDFRMPLGQGRVEPSGRARLGTQPSSRSLNERSSPTAVGCNLPPTLSQFHSPRDMGFNPFSLGPQALDHSMALASTNLPAVPAAIRKKVKHGKYVDFNVLFAHLDGVQIKKSFDVSLLPSSGDHPVIQYSSKKDSSKITDLSTWLRAWTAYLELNVCFHPHLTPQLVRYQGIIARFARQFQDRAWLLYDDMFRQKVALTFVSWDEEDSRLYNELLKGKEKFLPTNKRSDSSDLCFKCNRAGHLAKFCSSRSRMSGLASNSILTWGVLLRLVGSLTSICKGGHPKLRCKSSVS